MVLPSGDVALPLVRLSFHGEAAHDCRVRACGALVVPGGVAPGNLCRKGEEGRKEDIRCQVKVPEKLPHLVNKRGLCVMGDPSPILACSMNRVRTQSGLSARHNQLRASLEVWCGGLEKRLLSAGSLHKDKAAGGR